MTKTGAPLTPHRANDAAVDVALLRQKLARTRLLARARSAAIEDQQRAQHAAFFARDALTALARARTPGLRLNMAHALPGVLDDASAQLASEIGHDAAALPALEALHFVTSLYPALLPQGKRNALGAFYTPPALCSRLLDQATAEGLDWQTARLLDPSAGGGAFLFHAAVRLQECLVGCDPAFVLAQIGTRLQGFEIDPYAALIAQAAMEICLYNLSLASGRPAPNVIQLCDALDEPPQEGFDLVVGNPPYGRTTLAPEQRRSFARSLFGHANLYGLFTDLALRWTKPGGLVAYLTPTSFLAGQYYAALRGLLRHEAPPVAIDLVHSRRGVFEDVLQETLLAVYRKGAKDRRVQINHLHLTNEHDAQVRRNGTISLPSDPTAPWFAPRNSRQSQLVSRLEAMTERLSDWGYSVSTGPLVWNRFKSQLQTTAEGECVHPLIWAEAVTADGRFVFRAQKKNHAPYFKLQPGDAWLLVEEACVLVQRTTAKEQARRLIAAEMPATFVKEHGGVVVENHLNMVRADRATKAPPAVVTAILNSDVVDQVFRCMSGSVAVSAYELEALPLPSSRDLKTLTRLVARKASRGIVEAECVRLYGGGLA